jgi:hypothetical protein
MLRFIQARDGASNLVYVCGGDRSRMDLPTHSPGLRVFGGILGFSVDLRRESVTLVGIASIEDYRQHLVGGESNGRQTSVSRFPALLVREVGFSVGSVRCSSSPVQNLSDMVNSVNDGRKGKILQETVARSINRVYV